MEGAIYTWTTSSSVYITFQEYSGCGQIRVLLQVMECPSMTHETSSSAASTREFMKHATIDTCTRLPKNSTYTELINALFIINPRSHRGKRVTVVCQYVCVYVCVCVCVCVSC